jgi:hypothetical protein
MARRGTKGKAQPHARTVQLYLVVAVENREAEGRSTVRTEKDAIGMESFGVGSIAAEQVLGASVERTCS